MKEEILSLLFEAEDYVSGQELCSRLGVSRTAVWKHIKALKEQGYQIDSVTNKGYRLVSCPDLVTEMAVKPYLRTKWAGQRYVFYEETDSTNIRAKVLAEEGAPHGTLVVSERQTAGKGRRGKGWVSPAGDAVYMTLLLRPDIQVENASMLTLVSAMAVTGALRELLEDRIACGIKWPNDVIVNGKKVCGILTEMTSEPDYISSLVVGIGLNVNNQAFPPEVASVATSIFLETGQRISRGRLIGAVMQCFERYYAQFMKTQNLEALMEEYNGMLLNCGRRVRILEQEGERTARAIGINRHGALLVEEDSGETSEIIAGEVSVRGVLGYV